MFCPEANRVVNCKPICPFYCREAENCYKVLEIKFQLECLSQKERAALNEVRKGGVI